MPNIPVWCVLCVMFSTDTDKQKVLAVAQDWVPILDKVFGQKWCSDAWHIKEVASVVKAEGNADIALSPLGPGQASGIDALIRETLQPTLPPAGPREPNTGQSQWLQPEDLEVLSPPPEHQTVPVVSSPTGEPHTNKTTELHKTVLTVALGCFGTKALATLVILDQARRPHDITRLTGKISALILIK